MTNKTTVRLTGMKEASSTIRRYRERAPQAIVRAMNRAIVSSRTVMATRITSDIGLSAADVKAAMAVQNASPANLSAKLEASGARIPLIKFNAKGPYPSRGKGSGVTARISGGKGRYPRAFIAVMRGRRGVFQRVDRRREPTYELFGPSIPHVFRKYVPEGIARGQESLIKNLKSELKFAGVAA